jgi:hypothetical protein
MSWRIEHANPFALLAELPNELAQTCFVRAPRDLPEPCLLRILADVHRVLRDDGTLWLSLQGRGHSSQLAELIGVLGWRIVDTKSIPNAPGVLIRAGVRLLSKQPAFHFNLRRQLARNRHCFTQSCAGRRRSGACPPTRRPWCIPAGSTDRLTPEVIEWCIRTSTSPRACEVCGAAWRRWPGATTSEPRWLPACRHGKGRGRCIVLDPFCGLGQVGVLAVRDGRSFLGVESDFDTALRAGARLARCELGVPR